MLSTLRNKVFHGTIFGSCEQKISRVRVIEVLIRLSFNIFRKASGLPISRIFGVMAVEILRMKKEKSRMSHCLVYSFVEMVLTQIRSAVSRSHPHRNCS